MSRRHVTVMARPRPTRQPPRLTIAAALLVAFAACTSEDPDSPDDMLDLADDGADTSDGTEDSEELDVDSDVERPFTCFVGQQFHHWPEYDDDCVGFDGCDMTPKIIGICDCVCAACDYGRCMAPMCDDDPMCRDDAAP